MSWVPGATRPAAPPFGPAGGLRAAGSVMAVLKGGRHASHARAGRGGPRHGRAAGSAPEQRGRSFRHRIDWAERGRAWPRAWRVPVPEGDNYLAGPHPSSPWSSACKCSAERVLISRGSLGRPRRCPMAVGSLHLAAGFLPGSVPSLLADSIPNVPCRDRSG